jgi:exopolyphosphatase/pppGpp-phosphohydrolase
MRRIASEEDQEAFIRKELEKLPIAFHNNTPIILTGGIYRTMAKAYAKAHNFKLHDYDGNAMPCEISQQDYFSFVDEINSKPELQSDFKIKAERRPQLEPATLLVNILQEKIGAQNVILTKANMRYGVVAETHKKIIKPTSHAPATIITLDL